MSKLSQILNAVTGRGNDAQGASSAQGKGGAGGSSNAGSDMEKLLSGGTKLLGAIAGLVGGLGSCGGGCGGI
jgi:hypothetical protein